MKKKLAFIGLSILAGIAIAFGGTLSIVCKTKDYAVLGGILFSVGLFLVCQFGLQLYTGKIGYVTTKGKSFVLPLLVMLIMNFVGTVGFGYLFRLCLNGNEVILNTASNVTINKLVDLGNGGKPWWMLLISGILCGCLVFTAVDVYKNKKLNFAIRLLTLVICVSCFVIFGFDHCIANMYYFALSNSIFGNEVGRCFLSLLIVIVGNSIGAILTYYAFKFIKENK